jgi:hypothetical protein
MLGLPEIKQGGFMRIIKAGAPGPALLLLAGSLLLFDSAQALCEKTNFSAAVRFFSRARINGTADGYNVSFGVNANCPNELGPQTLTIDYDYKTQLDTGSTVIHQGRWTGQVAQTGASYITADITLLPGDVTVINVWVDKIS